MATNNHKLIREQLDQALKRFKVLQAMNIPPKGWMRAIRDALGMNGRQFAQRMSVSPARISKMESDEVAGAVTLKTLQRAAEALDCRLVYGLVPRTTLEDSVKKQIAVYAEQRFNRISHTMALEDQELTAAEKKKARKAMEEELLRNIPKSLWDK
jgi:predicted DNA-binding mobile mystery protein A